MLNQLVLFTLDMEYKNMERIIMDTVSLVIKDEKAYLSTIEKAKKLWHRNKSSSLQNNGVNWTYDLFQHKLAFYVANRHIPFIVQ